MITNNTLLRTYYTFLTTLVSSVERFTTKKDHIFPLDNIESSNFRNHLLGKQIIGAIPDLGEEAAFGCLDVDWGKKIEEEGPEKEQAKQEALEVTQRLVLQLQLSGISPIIEISKSGIGTHIWIPFSSTVSRIKLQNYLHTIIETAFPEGFDKSKGNVEVFPKGRKGGVGVLMPLFGILSSEDTLNEETIKNRASCLVDFDGNYTDSYLSRIKDILETNSATILKVFNFMYLPPCFQNAASSWQKGTRNAYVCGLAGVAKNLLNLDQNQASEIILDIAALNKDEEKSLRVAAIENTYSREEVAGCNILQGKSDAFTVISSLCSPSCSFYNKKAKTKSKQNSASNGSFSDEENSSGRTDNKFLPHVYANQLLEKFNILSDGDEGAMWVYEETSSLWVPEGEQKLKHFMQMDPDFLPLERKTTHIIKAILDAVRRITYIFSYNLQRGVSNDLVHLFPESEPTLVPFNNGVYDLKTDVFLPHSPDHYIRTKIPWNYNPKAKCPGIDSLFKGFVEEKDLINLYELLAYTLWRDNTRAQLMFILKGSGSNGKSLFMEILSKFVGQRNMSAQGLENLMNSTFSVSSLRDRLINDGGELPIDQTISRPQILKTLSAGDYVQADVKYEKPMLFRNYAKLIFYGNYLPKTSDTSKGFYRRLFIINFPFNYDKKKTLSSDSKAVVKVLNTPSEFEGLAIKAVQFLKQLYLRDFQFTNHPDWEDVSQLYEHESQPIFRFLKEFCVIDRSEQSYIPKFEFKDRLVSWIAKRGTSNPYRSDNVIYNEIRALSIEEAKKTVKVQGELKRYNCWMGIRWKDSTPSDSFGTNYQNDSSANRDSAITSISVNTSSIKELQLATSAKISTTLTKEVKELVPEMKKKVHQDQISFELDLSAPVVDTSVPSIAPVIDPVPVSYYEENNSSSTNILVGPDGIVRDIFSLATWVESQEFLSLDLETFSDTGTKQDNLNPFRNKIRLITIGNKDNVFVVDVLRHSDEEIRSLVTLFKTKKIMGHNLKFDLKTLATKYGTDVLPAEVFDTLLAAKILQRSSSLEQGGLGLGEVIRDYLGVSIDKSLQVSNWGYEVIGPDRQKMFDFYKGTSLNNQLLQKSLAKVVVLTPEQVQYAKNDIGYLSDLSRVMIKKIHESTVHVDAPSGFGCKDFIANLEMKFLLNLIRMELSGVPVNIEGLSELKNKYEKEYEELYANISSHYNIDNPNSQQQLLQYFRAENVQVLTKDLVTGDEVMNLISSTGEAVLAQVNHPLAHAVLDLRKKLKLKGMLEGYLKVYDDQRLHPTFTQIINTGRMACREPNVQQIPHEFKKIFYKAPEEKTIISIDYPAIELRILAAFLCKEYSDQKMVNNFKNNIDPHKATAALIYKKPISEVTPEERQSAKAINFGLSYGMGAARFREYAKGYGLDLSLEQAEDFRNKYKDAYKSLKTWHSDTGESLRDNDNLVVVKTLAGRVLTAGNYTDALNFPIQGTGGDITKYAINIFYTLLKEYPSVEACTSVVNVVHDDIIVETLEMYKSHVTDLLIEAMQESADYVLKYFKTEVEP